MINRQGFRGVDNVPQAHSGAVGCVILFDAFDAEAEHFFIAQGERLAGFAFQIANDNRAAVVFGVVKDLDGGSFNGFVYVYVSYRSACIDAYCCCEKNDGKSQKIHIVTTLVVGEGLFQSLGLPPSLGPIYSSPWYCKDSVPVLGRLAELSN